MKEPQIESTLGATPGMRPPRFTPPQRITISFAAMILIGAVLLTLPISSKSGESVGFLNALFTAASANCVTGLVVVNTLAHWTVFGKFVILVLIQLGGLGLITVMVMGMTALRRRVPLKDRLVVQALFNQSGPADMIGLVKKVLAITLVAEGAGAVLLAISFFATGQFTLWQAMYNGFFHSISAFCNAGFDIIGDSSMTPFRGNIAINFLICGLIVSGGLGFVVWIDIWETRKHDRQLHLKKHHMQRLKLHSKVALIATLSLIVSGMALFLLFEWSNPETLGNLPLGEKLLAAMFQSVTLRTAGFNTINQSSMQDVSQFLSCLLMLVGGSPAGTAGGIKTVTLGLIIIAMISVFRGRDKLEAFGRTLPLDLLQKALSIVCSMAVIVLVATFALHFTERNIAFRHDYLDLLFEVCSAMGTVGVTTGITPYLSTAGKVIITLCMFLGRLGPVTVVVSLNMRLNARHQLLSYPEERLVIG